MTVWRNTFVAWAIGLTLTSLPSRVIADDAGVEFFEKRIRPILVTHCFECHAADSKKLGGGLLLDSRDGVQAGGDSGAAVVSGKPDESLLIKAVRYTDDGVKMPPKGKLPAAAIADLEEWIKRGAPDPRDKPTAKKAAESWDETMRERARWWSLQPVQNPDVPQPRQADWSKHSVDRFLLARLEEQGLKPAAPADPRTLARRLSLVLTGLPPTLEQVTQFVSDCERTRTTRIGRIGTDQGGENPSDPRHLCSLPQPAIEKLVDLLLESPHFGERWARHWMDVVRFTETHGNEWNYEVHHAWRYRDYLIRAFNADVPFDQLIVEHIAGDLLPVGWVESSRPTTSNVRATSSGGSRGLDPPYKARWHATERFNESLIGTGFFRFGEVNHDDCISLPTLGYDIADNQLDTLTKAFQATTVACARCHNHKLDAVSMQDYYGLLGILRSSRLVSHCIDAPDVNESLTQRLKELKSELRKELASVWLSESSQLAKFLLAAMAKRANRPDAAELANGLDAQRLEKWVATLAVEKAPLEDPFEPARRLLSATDVAVEWQKLSEQYAAEDRSRSEFNRTQFETFGDLQTASGWQLGGQALRDGLGRSGDFALHPEGEAIVREVLPAGCFTHALSDKLNGTLRSPVLPLGKKHISVQVLGQRSSAVRLVSSHCQLNYKNYRALTSADLQWVTFSPPEERDSLRSYAELMTMFDNPKFPDQLAALGGDPGNYRLPWEKAAENPRSHFGITRAVLHDVDEPPRAELTHLRPLFRGARFQRARSESSSESEAGHVETVPHVVARYVTVIEAALQAWAVNNATDDDVRWLNGLLRRELLAHHTSSSPKLNDLVAEYRQTEAKLALPRVVAGVGESGHGADQPIFVRGDVTRPGEVAPRRFLQVLSGSRKPFAGPASGRLELAEQIADPRNPLTARVFVNRVWHHLFGTGLVRSVDDFGHVGERPSHPELLDHLATRFVTEGWSLKKLVRSLVLTRAFQMSNQPSAESREVDPQNRLLQHFPARRLEAEGIRDAMLVASGRLDRTLFGPSVQPFRDKDYADRRLFAGPLDGNGRRSVYIKNNLMEGPKFLETFNFPGGKVTQGRRDVTNVPAQALALLNDPFVLQQADVWAARLIARTDSSVAERLQTMFVSACQRPLATDEQARFEDAVRQLAELHNVPPNEVLKSYAVWKDVAHSLFNLKEFIYVP